MEKSNSSTAIPLPRWESFQIVSNEPGRDFPTGPYNRMIAKLYGTGGKPSEYIDASRMDNTSSRLDLADGQPVPPVSEGMLDKTPVRSFSVGELVHKTKQEEGPSRFGPAVAQHAEGSVSFEQAIHKIRQEEVPSRFGPVVTQHTEGSRQDNEPVIFGTAELNHHTHHKRLADKARLDTGLVQSGTGNDHPAEKFSATSVSASGQSEDLTDKVKLDGAPVDVAVGQLIHKTRQEKVPSRFGLAVTKHTEGPRQDNEPVIVGQLEPKHLADKARLDVGRVQSDTGNDHPAEEVSATVVSAGGQSKDLADKVKWDRAPAGVIFLCNNKTKQICFQYGLFGLPGHQLNLVHRIMPGTMLFLFVVESRELLGIFEASSNGGFNLEPMAFGPSFPSQVRFRIRRQCRPLKEQTFKKAIEDNYFQRNKFKNELTSLQVEKLLDLFCPEAPLDKEQKHENLMLNDAHAHGKKDFPVSAPAESQSEMSMEISSQDPQSSPAVDSHQLPHRMLFMGSHMGAQPSAMDASRDYQSSLKDVPAVSGQYPMGDQIHMQWLHSIPVEGSRHYYSPSMDGPMLSKSPYMDVMGGSQKLLTEETRLVQPSLDRFQTDSTAFLREASGEIHQPIVDVKSRALGKTPIESGHDIYADKRHHFSSSRVANGSYGLDASDNDRKGSLYGSGLQPHGSGSQSHILSEQAEEKGFFHLKYNLQDSMHQSYAPNASLHSWDGGVSGQRFSEADVEKGKFLSHDYLEASDHHISRSQLWSRAEVTGSSLGQNKFSQSNPKEREPYTSEGLRQDQAEQLATSSHMYKQDQQRSRENIGFNNSRDLSGGWVDASSFHSHKRLFEDPVDYASNPVKRQHYYSESHGELMSDERVRFVNGASLGGNWMGNASWAGNSMSINDKLSP